MLRRDFHNVLVVVFVSLAVGCLVDLGGASTCKTIIKNSIIQRCSGTDERTRRHVLDNQDGQAQSNAGEGAVRNHDKRQLNNPGAAIASLAAPIVTEVVNGALRMNSYPAPPPAPLFPLGIVPYGATGTSPLFLAAPPPQPKLPSSLWPQEIEDGLGYEAQLSHHEIEELYTQLSQRLPRQTKGPMNREDFQKMAYECCRNINLCHQLSKDIMACV